MADMTVAEIRALITKHKRWDLIFATVGVLALMVGVLTFVTLFAGMVMAAFLLRAGRAARNP